MAAHSWSSFTPMELAFMAGDELVAITPSFTKPLGFRFLTGTFAPFQAGIPIRVPLWLAYVLKEMGKCRITCPAWMGVEALNETLRRERKPEEKSTFTPLPFYYFEISQLLFRVAPDDIPQVQEVMALILELRILRESKLASGMRDVLSEGAIVANVTNVSATEANYLREGFMKAFDVFQEFTEAQREAEQRSALYGGAASRPTFSRGRGGAGAGSGGAYLSSPDRRDLAAYQEEAAEDGAAAVSRPNVRGLLKKHRRPLGAAAAVVAADGEAIAALGEAEAGAEAAQAVGGNDSAQLPVADGVDSSGGLDELAADAPSNKLRRHR